MSENRGRMRSLAPITLFLTLAISSLVQAARQPDLASKIDDVLSSKVAPDEPGAAVIVVKDGHVLYRKARGMASIELGVPLQPEMVFRLGSITKQFTAAAVMILAEQGKLSVQDPITKFLPDYPTQAHTITIEHLLTHTSGIQSYTEMPGWMESKILADLSLQELIDGFKKEPMAFAPGEKWEYNNSGYVLLGAIIEKASGETYEAFIRKNIFEPLGMKSSYYGSNEPLISKRTPGYTGQPGSVVNARYLSMTQPHAAGALLSTVDDLARWDEALYAEKLLKKASIDRMFSRFTLKDGKSTSYGYGFSLGKLQGHETVEHGGGIFGFSTFGLRMPEDHVYVAVLCNSDAPKVSPSFIAKTIAAIAIGKPLPEQKAIQLDPKILQRYVGVYQIDEKTRRTVTLEDGKLFTQRAGGVRLEAKPRTETEFFYEYILAHFRFVLDENGAVTEMLMYQDGSEEPEKAVRTNEAPAVRKEASVDPAIYDRYTGVYELTPGFLLTITREGDKLMTQATGQEKVEIYPESETKFFLKVVDAQITFVVGPDGTAAELILNQGGAIMKARKKK